MPVELRKRKPRDPPPAPAPAKKKSVATKAKEVVKKVEKAVTGKGAEKKEAAAPTTAAPAAAGKPVVGDTITLDGFGGEVETNDGKATTLKALVEESKGGVVLFTYPKASTPGCTKQVCFFRDSYDPITKAGFAIYGLSADSGKANTTFKTKQKLQYPLLCDPKTTLIAAIGLKKGPSGTQRGVFVVNKQGKVLLAEPGSPQGTVDAVLKIVEEKKEGGAEEKKEMVGPAVGANGDAKETEKKVEGEKVEEEKE